MLILLRLDPADARAMRSYRLQVKERLYRFNFVRDAFPNAVCRSFATQEVLVHLDKEERLEKLEETFQGVREDYLRIVGLLSHLPKI